MEKRIFSCLTCGNPFDAYPLDDYHTSASIKESKVGDPIKVVYDCKMGGCEGKNTIYWGRRTGAAVVV